jgi:endonuclease YncB( thermonuclease family)
VHKLGVKVLPCVVMFLQGKAYDRIVGFEEFGQRDDFNTALLEARLLGAGAVQPRERTADDSDSDEEGARARATGRVMRQGGKPADEQDEDSDFD